MQNEQKIEEAVENPANETEKGEEGNAEGNGGGEFKLTVRKLELPVRPRGVLAE